MKGVGFSPSGPVKANTGVRARVPAAGKVLEGDDQQIYVHYITTMENVNFMTHRLTHIQRERDVICDDLQQISKLFGTSVRAVRTADPSGLAIRTGRTAKKQSYFTARPEHVRTGRRWVLLLNCVICDVMQCVKFTK